MLCFSVEDENKEPQSLTTYRIKVTILTNIQFCTNQKKQFRNLNFAWIFRVVFVFHDNFYQMRATFIRILVIIKVTFKDTCQNIYVSRVNRSSHIYSSRLWYSRQFRPLVSVCLLKETSIRLPLPFAALKTI